MLSRFSRSGQRKGGAVSRIGWVIVVVVIALALWLGVW
jgi:hypothetical protein